MNTSNQPPVDPQTQQLDESDKPIDPELPDDNMVSLVVHTVSGDVIRRVGRVEREMELEEKAQNLYKRARKLMEEADRWDLRLKDYVDRQIVDARSEVLKRDRSINLFEDRVHEEISYIKRWQAGDGRREFMGSALGKLLDALEIIRGMPSKEARILQDELVAKFSSLLDGYKRAHSGGNEPSYAHHEYLVRFLEIACGFHTEEGLPVGLEKNAADGINTLMASGDWENSMDKGMDLLELVCPFYSTSPTGQRMFAVIMGHLDRLMKMDLEYFASPPTVRRTPSPDEVKEEEKKWKDYYQKACDDVLHRNKLPKHKFKREERRRREISPLV